MIQRPKSFWQKTNFAPVPFHSPHPWCHPLSSFPLHCRSNPSLSPIPAVDSALCKPPPALAQLPSSHGLRPAPSTNGHPSRPQPNRPMSQIPAALLIQQPEPPKHSVKAAASLVDGRESKRRESKSREERRESR